MKVLKQTRYLVLFILFLILEIKLVSYQQDSSLESCIRLFKKYQMNQYIIQKKYLTTTYCNQETFYCYFYSANEINIFFYCIIDSLLEPQKKYNFDNQMATLNLKFTIILATCNIGIIIMMGIKLILYFLLVAAAFTKVHQVVSLFRHGARYHLNSYYDGNSTLPFWGQLTSVGMRQHETLGKLIRKDYIENQKFISNNFKQGEIEVFSSNFNRTIQSVLSQLYGIYSLGTGPKIPIVNNQYHLPPYSNITDSKQTIFALPQAHQTIPVTISNKVILYDCPNLSNQMTKNLNRQPQTFKQMYMTYYPFLKSMATLFDIQPIKNMNFSQVVSLYDTLTVDKFLGKPMPKNNFTDDDYVNLQHLHQWYILFRIGFNASRALNTYKFQRIINDFDDRIANLNNKTLKWTVLSAHDTDMAAAIVDLNITTPQCVQQKYRKGSTSALNCESHFQFASNLIFELHSDNSVDFYVKIRHEGKYVYLCQRRQIFCPYSQWKQRIQRYFINVDQICRGSTNNANSRYEASLLE